MSPPFSVELLAVLCTAETTSKQNIIELQYTMQNYNNMNKLEPDERTVSQEVDQIRILAK